MTSRAHRAYRACTSLPAKVRARRGWAATSSPGTGCSSGWGTNTDPLAAGSSGPATAVERRIASQLRRYSEVQKAGRARRFARREVERHREPLAPCRGEITRRPARPRPRSARARAIDRIGACSFGGLPCAVKQVGVIVDHPGLAPASCCHEDVDVLRVQPVRQVVLRSRRAGGRRTARSGAARRA